MVTFTNSIPHYMHTLKDVRNFLSNISMSFMGNDSFRLRIEEDVKFGGRIFPQVLYEAPCTKDGRNMPLRGRKWYLSNHMTEGEVIFTAYTAFELTIKHEIMESFKIGGVTLVNPHVDYKKLLEISSFEVTRGGNIGTLDDLYMSQVVSGE